MKTIIIFGAGGHSKVIIDLINELNIYTIIGIYDDIKKGTFEGINILTNYDNISADEYIIGIGDNNIRKKIYEKFKTLKWATLIHPRSIISKSAIINKGTVIFAGAIIQPYVIIEKHCIINTNCNIDHESNISNFVSICPGVTICGNVNIGELSFIGANTTIIQNIFVGKNCIVGAGTVIIKNVNNNSKIVGNPARLLKYLL
jgi:sugar O-acyltransferase (sialic acid O-acetyltransferase NeuD family)